MLGGLSREGGSWEGFENKAAEHPAVLLEGAGSGSPSVALGPNATDRLVPVCRLFKAAVAPAGGPSSLRGSGRPDFRRVAGS